MDMSLKYKDYFEIDEEYFPCIDEAAINKGVDWKSTYPHSTFIELLDKTEKMLGGSTNRSVWIHGAYGTGKSQCAYALKKILECSDGELDDYWGRYDALSYHQTLMDKIKGHKARNIITAFRYASGSMNSPQLFFNAVQESIKKALEEKGISNKGEMTLKESAIAWLEEDAQKQFVNALLSKPKWKSLFAQSSADEIINSLRKNSDITSLMENLFRLAAEEGVTALSLDADKLCAWIKDVITSNNIKIVFVWDEFSDFFRLNKNSLGDFQKVVSLCQEVPFYFIVVTHPISSLSADDDSWKIVQQRFDKVEIKLPENIAFDLIGAAFKVKEAAKNNWETFVGQIDTSIYSAKKAVMDAAKITKPSVMQNILPLHPMAALVLKNIASAFQSNQRSMFDFIKTPKDLDVKAFQWFISEKGPANVIDNPYLTIDMLWDFFYVKGRDYLSSDIRLILDTFPQQTALQEKEKNVLKTILILQAISQKLGGAVPVLRPTEQNIRYAFEGVYEYQQSAVNIAKALVTKGILISSPIGNGQNEFNAAVLAGDSGKIEAEKQKIRKKTTNDLVTESEQLPFALSMPPALKLRFGKSENGDMVIATSTTFVKIMDSLKNKDYNWHFNAVLAVAKDEDEAISFRQKIKGLIANEDYKNIIVIDALSSPLGLEKFEQYVEYSAMALYYQGNNNQQAKDYGRRAKEVLNITWKNTITGGQFYVYSYANQVGEPANGAQNLHVVLQTLVLNRFRYVLDFTRGLTESQLKMTPAAKQCARAGMGDVEVKGIVSGCDKTVLGAVWGKENYWELDELQSHPIVVAKKALDNVINKEFESGKISIGQIIDFLQETFGYTKCNLNLFVLGFLLKEYSRDPYRAVDENGYPESMTPDKLAEMIVNYAGKDKITYILKLTPQEKAFYEGTETAWGLMANSSSNPEQTASFISAKMREMGYPVWTLEYVDNGSYDIVKKYIALVQCKDKSVHNKATEIGSIFINKPTFVGLLKELLSAENCQKGMTMYLKSYAEGQLMAVAKEIGADASILADVKNIFSVKHSALWEYDTGNIEIQKLSVDYKFVKQANILLNTSCKAKDKAINSWYETLQFIGISCEAIRLKKPELDRIFYYLYKVARQDELLSDDIKGLHEELIKHFDEIRELLSNPVKVFSELYATYLEGYSLAEIEIIQNKVEGNLFLDSITMSNQKVKNAAAKFKEDQKKTQLMNKWKALTGARNPIDWSNQRKIPILCCIPDSLYTDAKKAFAIINKPNNSEQDIDFALNFLDNNELFENLKDSEFVEAKFVERIVGEYSVLLVDVQAIKDALNKLPYEVYDWCDNPIVRSKIEALASAEYNAGGSDKAITVIDGMSDSELKARLKELVQKDIDLGVKLIINGRK